MKQQQITTNTEITSNFIRQAHNKSYWECGHYIKLQPRVTHDYGDTSFKIPKYKTKIIVPACSYKEALEWLEKENANPSI